MSQNNYAYSPVPRWSHINQEGVEEEVFLERWIWTALYEDNSERIQFDQSGQFHQFQEIDLERIQRFSMVCTDDIRKQISLALTPEMQPFHFCRNTVLNANQPNEVRLKTYCFGYKNKRTGEAMYHYILPDDRLVITADKNFNPIKQGT